MTLERDSRLGKYVIRARIGAGGMGAVYRAYDTLLKREVAIKTILADKVTERDYLARFRREALAISQLDDPHIVRLLDFVEGDSSQGVPPYMVMELLRGQDLYSIIRKGPVPIERAVDILLGTCAAVGTCHRSGFVHRDLKATNIFVTEYNAVEFAKVLDFGVAKAWGEGQVGEGVDLSEVTRKGIAVGTPEYLAPEILRGGPASPRSDQYALGIVLYAALTGGRRPFEAQKNGEFRDLHLLQAILKGDHPGPRSYHDEIPEALEQVIERAMAHDPERRFPSVHALGEALLEWASPRARLQWTGHFTSAPKPPVVQPSMAMSPAEASYAHGAAAQARPAPAGTAVTRKGKDETLGSPSLVIVEDGASVAPVSGVSTVQPVSKAPRLPRILVAGSVAAALGIGIAVFMKGSERASDRPPGPPAELSAGAPVLPPSQPVSPPVPPPPSPEPPTSPVKTARATAPGQSEAVPAAHERKSRVRRRAKKPKVDENGIGIPSD